MSVLGITSAARTAIAAAITANGLTCRTYDTADVGAGPSAALGAPTWELVTGPDQKYGLQTITFPIFIYQTIGSSSDANLGYQDTNFETVVDALGDDRTLGGKFANSDVVGDPGEVFVRTASGALFSVVQVDLRVWPFPNAAS